MIDEYDKNYWLLSCDICGVTEEGPFETFDDAVLHKKDNPDKWKSLRLRNDQTGKTEWHDVCAGCFPKTVLGKWKIFPVSGEKPKQGLKTGADLTNMANSIARVINKRKRGLYEK
jgi:hypothetical protein